MLYINDALVLENWTGVKTPLLLKSEWYARGEVKVVLEPKGPGVGIQNIKLLSAKNEEAIKKILSQLKKVKEEVEEKPKEEIKKISSREFTSTIRLFPPDSQVENIILLIGDGMGLVQITSSRIKSVGINVESYTWRECQLLD